MKTAIIIGAGIGGLAAASLLAKAGLDVTVFEKNDKPGGRINYFKADGFTFDMGPSWYWMPEVFEDFYKKFGHTTSDFYNLIRLDPSYDVFFKSDLISKPKNVGEALDSPDCSRLLEAGQGYDHSQRVSLPANYSDLRTLFDSIEPGSADRLDVFLAEAEYKYKVGMTEFVWKPGKSLFEFADIKVFKSVFKLQMLSSVKTAVAKVVKDQRLKQILEFPVLFLGATPADTPALYSLMNYADIKLGTWYPEGGMYKIAEAFYKIALSQGVKFEFNTPIDSFTYHQQNTIQTAVAGDKEFTADFIIANADYHHIDQQVLAPEFRQYDSSYWNSRKMAPSSLLVFLGVNKKLPGLRHHNLFFDADFEGHAHEIYKDPKWPSDPLFYACCPSVTDPTVAPPGKENLFLLMPLAPDLTSNKQICQTYLDQMITRIETHLKLNFKSDIIFQKFFCVEDFKSTYNAFKGNAYGLANTLTQTAVLKPSLKSKKISNLFYAGQLTTPGPGLPPSIISGQVAAAEILKRIHDRIV